MIEAPHGRFSETGNPWTAPPGERGGVPVIMGAGDGSRTFGIGTAEILVILCMALVVPGPRELPKVARTVERGTREIQRAGDDLKEVRRKRPETAARGGRKRDVPTCQKSPVV